MPELYVVVALFNFEDFPVFNMLIGTANNIARAFQIMDDYDYKKVIASKYEMTVEENLAVRGKTIGHQEGTTKIFYEELRHYTYQIKGEEEKYPVKVTLSIFQA